MVRNHLQKKGVKNRLLVLLVDLWGNDLCYKKDWVGQHFILIDHLVYVLQELWNHFCILTKSFLEEQAPEDMDQPYLLLARESPHVAQNALK